jgi:hypothetical protein
MTDTTTQPEVSQERLDAIEVSITMTVKEINALLTVLGNAPFIQAAALVNLVQSQAAPQVQSALATEQAE